MDAPRLSLRPSPLRLWIAVAIQGGLALVLLWIALAHPPASLGWRLFLLAAAAANGWSALSLHGSRDRALVLEDGELRDTGGETVCRIADVERVSRGAFALKPARGFSLRLARGARRRWVPGLWWRVGRTVGVGGVTGSADTRLMAEMIQAMVAARALGQVPPASQRT